MMMRVSTPIKMTMPMTEYLNLFTQSKQEENGVETLSEKEKQVLS
tara:strand:+ start:1377 stop:1511 length:135 start_codon:yes stop_codon:yes gene_type:complete